MIVHCRMVVLSFMNTVARGTDVESTPEMPGPLARSSFPNAHPGVRLSSPPRLVSRKSPGRRGSLPAAPTPGLPAFPVPGDGEGGAGLSVPSPLRARRSRRGTLALSPRKGVAPLTPRPQVKRSRPERSQAGGAPGPHRPELRHTPFPEAPALIWNRGGRAAWPRPAAAIGCGGAGDISAGCGWSPEGRSESAPAPEPESQRQPMPSGHGLPAPAPR